MKDLGLDEIARKIALWNVILSATKAIEGFSAGDVQKIALAEIELNQQLLSDRCKVLGADIMSGQND